MLLKSRPAIQDHFQSKLLDWYHEHKRELPFRRTRDPYRIWLSEIMLQQTTVATVVDYYERFTRRFPDVTAVATADDAELLRLWQGLGYYSRVRNFKTACRQVLTEFGGKIPEAFSDLKKLRGIGDYTAAAIASIAFGRPHAVIDGNVKRVLSRLFNYTDEIDSKGANGFFTSRAEDLLDKNHPGDFNQAMMELGAVICRPQNPACPQCPVKDFCASRDKNPETLPVRKKQIFLNVDYQALIITNRDKLLLRKPGAKSLIKGMWEVPSIYEQGVDAGKTWSALSQGRLKTERLEKIGSVRHSITNKRITVHVYRHPVIRIKNTEHEFVRQDNLEHLPLNTLSRKIIEKYLPSW